MGCCVSTSVSAAARRGRPDAAGAAAGNSARSGTSVAGRDHHHNHLVFREGNKPLRRRPLLWASEHPMTMSQLRAAREAFWETAPSYEGRIEIWQALRLACECEDLALAQAIVRSANIMVPTGDLSEGCYDELGNRYSIPQYCFSPPTNLVVAEGGEPGAIPGAGEDANTIAGTDDEKLGAKGKSRHSSSSSPSVRTNETTAATLAAAEKSAASPAHERSVTVRLSTGTDLKLRVPADEKIAGLRKKVLDALREKEKGEDGEEIGGATPAAAGGGGGGPGGGGGGAGGERDAGDGKEPAIKFFFLGRMLGDKVRLRELKLPDHGGIVQALVPPP